MVTILKRIFAVIKVANIIEEGRLGGPQVRMVCVAEQLKYSVKTTIIMPSYNSRAFQEICKSRGVSYQVLPITHMTREWKMGVRYITFSLIEIIRLTLYLRRNEFDLVHVSGGSWQYKGIIAGKLAKKKVLWHLNDTSMPRFIHWLFLSLNSLADGFIFASKRTRKYYSDLIKKGVLGFEIPAPVDTKSFKQNESYNGDDEIITRWEGKIVIGMVANINPVKGIEDLVRTAALLRDCEIEICFCVIGEIYPNQERYFHLIKQLMKELSVDSIEFVGSRKDVRRLLQRLDIYLCCSTAESSPIAVWEAMAMSKPIVSTDVGDVSRFIIEGKSGFIVNVGDHASLAHRLLCLLKNKKMRLEFGRNARETAVCELDLTKCADRHLVAYQTLLSK